MALFRFLWLRRFVRRHTKPIEVDRASSVKQKLSIAYMFLAWNAFGLVAYAVYKGKNNWAVYHGVEEESSTPAMNYARMLKIDNAKVIRFSGLRKEDEYDIEVQKDGKVIKKPLEGVEN